MQETYKVINRRNRRARVRFVKRRVHGKTCFSFYHETLHEYENPLGQIGSYWEQVEGFGGGFYENAEAAEAVCRAGVEWLEGIIWLETGLSRRAASGV